MNPATTPAQRPPEAKLLVVHSDGRLHHETRTQLARLLAPGDLLIANDAATIPASLSGFHEPTGATLAGR